MSLINDALKKAQRLRQEQEAANTAGQVGRPQRRGSGLSTQMLIVFGAAGAVLVVISIVGTVLWVNRTPEPKPAVSTTTAATAKPKTAIPGEPPKVVVVPPTTGPKSETAPTAAPPSNATPETTTSPAATTLGQNPKVAVSVPAPVAQPEAAGNPHPSDAENPAEIFRERVSTPAPPAARPPPVLPQPDPRIQNFVDTIRISGVRAAGSESRVLMNDRVFRINDIVDRTLGIKLVKVTSDTLTFADANGFTYTRSL